MAFYGNEIMLPLCKRIQMCIPFLITFKLIVLAEISPQRQLHSVKTDDCLEKEDIIHALRKRC